MAGGQKLLPYPRGQGQRGQKEGRRRRVHGKGLEENNRKKKMKKEEKKRDSSLKASCESGTCGLAQTHSG